MGMLKGLFISLEGGEGSGKSGLAEKIEARLKARGVEVVRTREPGGKNCPAAEELRGLVVSGAADRWSPMAELLIFMAARREHIDQVIRPALAAGKAVLCDRFLDSTLAYQGIKGVPEDTILAVQKLCCDDLRPDLTLLLDVDPEIGLARSGRRLAEQASSEDRFEGLGLDYHRRIRASFLAAAEREPWRVRVVDASKTPDEVERAAFAELDRIAAGTKVSTSASSPLRIAAIPCGNGVVGVTLCPGKTQPSSISGTFHARDLDADLDAVRDWGADAVVTLIEDHEFDLLRVRGLGPKTVERGMIWLRAPITDRHAPDGRFERDWPKAAPAIEGILEGGGKVLVHCMGGLGRAGTVAAFLLSRFGEDMESAIAKVRAARPGAIETSGQEDWLRARAGRP